MKKYYLGLNKRSQEINEVTWARGPFKDLKPNNLEHIDRFCMCFKDEEDLKMYLMKIAIDDYHNGLTTSIPDFSKKLCVKYHSYKRRRKTPEEMEATADVRPRKNRYVSTKIVKVLSDGALPFAKDDVYFKYEELIRIINLFNNEPTLLFGLARKFAKTPVQRYNLDTFERAANRYVRGEPFTEHSRLYVAISNFVRYEVVKYDKDAKECMRYPDGTYVINWRKLRDVAMYVKSHIDTKHNSMVEHVFGIDPKGKTLQKTYQQPSMFD